jgi:hypothetical protein
LIPLSQATLFYSAYFDYNVDDYKAALEKLNECLEHNPKNIPDAFGKVLLPAHDGTN